MMIRNISFAFALFSAAAVDRSAAFSASPTNIRTSTALNMAAGEPALTLYGHPGTRSPLVNWGCNEVGIPVSVAQDLSKNPHPFGQLPCLVDGEDAVVFESGAILQYLHKLETAKDENKWTKAQSAAITSWITWANASLDPICFIETPEGKVYDTGLKKDNKRLDQVNQILGKQKYLVEDSFSLADVAVVSYLNYVLQFFPNAGVNDRLASVWPNIARYMRDCTERQGYADAFGTNVQQYLLQQLDSGDGNKKKLFGMF